MVRKWREISEDMRKTSARDSGKFSLEEAAKSIGIPRKSLDDYLFVLRRARELDFDFERNLKFRFGIVRAFVRKFYKGKKEGSSGEERIRPSFNNDGGDNMSNEAASIEGKSKKIHKYF